MTFTLEKAIGDQDHTLLSGATVVAAIATAVEHSILGQHPVFEFELPRTSAMGPLDHPCFTRSRDTVGERVDGDSPILFSPLRSCQFARELADVQ
jgi:hypothetical protein